MYLYLLHQLVLFFVVCLGELVDLDFVLLDFPHDLAAKERIFQKLPAELIGNISLLNLMMSREKYINSIKRYTLYSALKIFASYMSS